VSRQTATGVPPYADDIDEATRREAFLAGEVPVAVYGLGKMGLPLAAVYADVTGNTVGVDVDESVVRTVNAGDCHVKREPGLSELVADVVDRGALHAESDPVMAADASRLHVLMVPTLLDEDDTPNLSALTSAVRDIGGGLSPGDLVIVESTVPPRTTADHVVPLLAEESGLDPDEFGAAACPERTVSGQALADIRGTHPKVVGGVDAESTRAAGLFYDEITANEVIETADAATAEAVKVFEGVYRDVNIALANQLALYADALDVDVRGAIDVANTQPFCDIHDPGPGVGGHCIPVYPYFLAGAFDARADLIEAARSLNDAMAEHAVDLLGRALATLATSLDGATVALLGVTYKENIAELRNAPSVPIASDLVTAGADVLAVDPLVDDWSAFEGVDPVQFDDLVDRHLDAVVALTAHDEFADIDWSALPETVVLDGRGAFDLADTAHDVYTIGGETP
jgi:UDP-N-acetyl-D-mannosaminuronic acid dehydrogenase